MGIPVGSGVKVALTDVMTGEEIAPKRDDHYPQIPAHSFKIYRAKCIFA
jgi:hypothetical protein